MWPAHRRKSDENKITGMQTSQRKSVGRSPLQDLAVQGLTLSEENIFANTRSSNKPTSTASSVSKLHVKDTSVCNKGTPVSIWVDSSPNEACSSKALRPVSLFETKFKPLNQDTSDILESNSNCEKIHVSDPVSSDQTQNLYFGDQEEFLVDGVHTELQICTDPEESCSVSVVVPWIHPRDVCGETTGGSSFPDIASAQLFQEENNSELDIHFNLTSRSCLPEKDKMNISSCVTLDFSLNTCHNLPDESYNIHSCKNAEMDEPLTNFENNTQCVHNATDLSTVIESCNEVMALANETYTIDPCLSAATEHFENCSIFLSADEVLAESVELKICNVPMVKDNAEDCSHFLSTSDVLPEFQDLQIKDESKSCRVLPDCENVPYTMPTVNDIAAQQLDCDNSLNMVLCSLFPEVLSDVPHDLDCEVIKDNAEEHNQTHRASEYVLTKASVFQTEGVTVDCKAPLGNLQSETVVGLHMKKNIDNGVSSEINAPFSNLLGGKDFEEISPPCPDCDRTSKTVNAKESTSPLRRESMQETPKCSFAAEARKSLAVSAENQSYSIVVKQLQSRISDVAVFNMSAFTRLTPEVQSSPVEVGTCLTPTSSSTTTTWTTPIMLLNKSVNTPWDLVGNTARDAKDNCSETDSLLWNFSRESLNDASREELINRLESTLIVIEVLSRQLQGWQRDLGCSRPSEQRESSTQTCVTYSSTEEQYYHNLYIKTMERLQLMQRCREEEEKLSQMISETTDNLESHKTQSASMIEFAENLFEIMQKDKDDLNKKVSQARTLVADHMTLLKKMEEKMQANQLQRNEMSTHMEKALCVKEATDQCLKDLEKHSSMVIAQLQRDLESEKHLCETVKEAYQQQLSYNEELVEFSQKALSVCSEMEEDRNHLQLQCSQARELMSHHWRLFEVMKKRTRTALQEYESLKRERDLAYSENDEVCAQLADVKHQNAQLKTETTRLGSELASLLKHLCDLETEVDQLKQENCEQMEELCAKDCSLKLLGKELDEATIRGQEIQDRNKQLSAEVIPRLEMDLSKALQENQALQKHLQEQQRQHLSQIAAYKESIEFLEQENSICRKQDAETELQLKNNLFALRERNLQCETQKDMLNDLQRELNKIQEELLSTKTAAHDMILKMGKEISDSSIEVSKIREILLEQTGHMRGSQLGEQTTGILPHTPAKCLVPSSTSFVGSVLKARYEESKMGSEARNAETIWSERSAFTIVQPITSPPADDKEESLPDILRELRDVVSCFVDSSSNVMETKEQANRDLKREISSLKEEMQSMRFQNTNDLSDLQEETEILRRKNRNLEDNLNSKQQCIRELEEIVHQQEQRILQQFSKEKEREDLSQENAKLKRSLQLCESEVKVLKGELSKSQADAARDWLQEKLLLHNDLTKLRLMLLDTQNAKSENAHRAMRHREILEENLARSEMELKKLDDILETVRKTLLSIPEVVSKCDTLKQVMEYLG